MVRQREEIQELRRGLGQALATYRSKASLTQGRLAEITHYDRTSINHIEKGRQFPERDFWKNADRAISAGGKLLDSYDSIITIERKLRQDTIEQSLVTQVQSRLTHSVGSFITSALPPLAETAPGDERESTTFGAFAGRPDVSSRDIDTIRAMSHAFQTADRQVGGGRLYSTVIRYLNHEVAPQMLDVSTRGTSVELFSAAASLTEIAGWMAHDGGLNDRARRHFDHAFRLSSAAHNLALSANVCASMSHLAIQIDQPRDAVRIADAGLSRAIKADGATRLQARLYAMRARGLATSGDDTGCLDAIRTAEKILANISTEENAEWIANFDVGSLASETALCFRSLGKLKGAERSALQAIKLRNGDRVRSRAFAQLTLADVLVTSGRIDEAALIGQHVCELASGLNSARVLAGLSRLTDSLRHYSVVPEVKGFLDSWKNVLHKEPSVKDEDRAWPV